MYGLQPWSLRNFRYTFFDFFSFFFFDILGGEGCKVAPYIAYLALFIRSPFIREISRSLDHLFSFLRSHSRFRTRFCIPHNHTSILFLWFEREFSLCCLVFPAARVSIILVFVISECRVSSCCQHSGHQYTSGHHHITHFPPQTQPVSPRWTRIVSPGSSSYLCTTKVLNREVSLRLSELFLIFIWESALPPHPIVMK